MKLQDIKDSWNQVADQYNQWDSLDYEEMIEYTLSLINNKEIQMTKMMDVTDIINKPDDIECVCPFCDDIIWVTDEHIIVTVWDSVCLAHVSCLEENLGIK